MDLLFEKHKKTIAISLSTIAALTLLLNALFKKDKNKIPIVPYTWPFLGSTLELRKNHIQFARNSTLNYGRSFRAHLNGRLVTILGTKSAVEVFKHPDFSFRKSKLKFIGPNFMFPKTKMVLPHNILKEIVQKHMTPNIDIYGPRSNKKFQQVADRIIQESYVADNLMPFVRDMVGRANATSLLGSAASEREDLIYTFKSCVDEISQEQNPSLARLIFPFINSAYLRIFRPKSTRIFQHKDNIRAAILSELEKKKKLKESGLESEEVYLIDYILDTYPREMNDAYIESLVFAVLMIVFFGVHTTSNAAFDVLSRLVLHNEYIDELRQEQEEIYAEQPDAEFVHALSKKMVKLDSFIRESSRFRMTSLSLPHTYVGKEEVHLPAGEVIQPGEEVLLNMWQVHMLPYIEASYNKDLEEFKPFRYVNMDKPATKIGEDYISFGLGKHACPGRWFAVHQLKNMLSVLIRNYDMAPVDPIQLKNGQRSFSGAVKFTKRVKH